MRKLQIFAYTTYIKLQAWYIINESAVNVIDISMQILCENNPINFIPEAYSLLRTKLDNIYPQYDIILPPCPKSSNEFVRLQ